MSNYPPEKAIDQQQQQNPFGQGYDMYSSPPTGNAGATGAAGFGDYGQGFPPPSGAYPGVVSGPPADFMDPTVPRPNDILPLHPAIIQQRQIAASLPPCPKGGHHELRTRLALGANAGTLLSFICFPIVCCCIRDETVCIKCNEKFNIILPRI
ncbi:hypothetical protein BGZ65_009169, partial [Modicella reniformis]